MPIEAAGAAPTKQAEAREKAKLTYPLENQDEYPGKLVFKVFDEEASRKNFAEAIEGQRKKLLTSENPGDAEPYADGASKNFRTKLKGEISDKFFGEVGKLASRFDKSLQTSSSKGSVHLYLPQALQIQDGVSYSNFDLGNIGLIVEKAGGSIGKAVTQGAGQALDDLKSLFTRSVLTSDGAALAAQRIAKNISPEAAGAISQITGVTPNPNTRAQFSSVPLRNFSFQFAMIPKSAREAEEIKQIIRWFRTELYPEVIAGGFGYRFPNRFQIVAKYRNKEHVNGIKFLPVYLQNIGAVYNPTGAAMHRDGSFNEVQITLQFVESRPLSRADIQQGGY